MLPFTPIDESKWIPDNQRGSCQACALAFSMTKRRHHCRSCGEVFCDDCAPPVGLVPPKTAARLCEHCFPSIDGKAFGVIERKNNKNKFHRSNLCEINYITPQVNFYRVDNLKESTFSLPISSDTIVREMQPAEKQLDEADVMIVIESSAGTSVLRCVSAKHKQRFFKLLLDLVSPAEDQKEKELRKKSIKQNAEGVMTPGLLIAAAREGDLTLVKQLVQNPSYLNHRDRHQATACIWAAHDGNAKILQSLVEAKCDLECHNNYKKTALLYAARSKTPVLVKILLSAKANPDGGVDDNPLHVAVRENREDNAKLLIQAKSNVNCLDNNGATPLLWSVRNGHTAITTMLLQSKADVNASNNFQKDALFYAARGADQVLLALVEKAAGRKANKPDVEMKQQRT